MVSASDDNVVPSTLENIAWWSGGGHPGANPSNTAPPLPDDKRYTTYLYGHSWCDQTKDPTYCQASVFDYLKNIETGSDAVAIVTTTDGTQYLYHVVSGFTVSKKDEKTDPRLIPDVIGRLVTLTCYRPEDYPIHSATTANYAVIWQVYQVIPPIN